MRSLLTLWLFAASVSVVLVGASSLPVAAQDKKTEPKKAQPKADPKANAPDEAMRKQIAEKTEQLRQAIAAIKPLKAEIAADVLVYLKAAEWIVRHEEWLQADSAKQTLRVLDAGLERAKAAAQGKAPWLDVRGKPVVRGYVSRVDGSMQPYSVNLPADYGQDKNKPYRLDIVLHGRDGSLTEVKFINGKENAKAGAGPAAIVLEVYGRGNNAYRWSGESDVFEAVANFSKQEIALGRPAFDANRVVLRGFSMGGAGTWHIGLHHPGRFCVIGPGAGFTTTHGYIANLPQKLPDHQEKCLRIYDAIDYAENAFNVPVVAYSGEKDAQKKAADNIENELKSFKESVRFTHLVAPGLEHQMPAEWQAKAEAEYRKFADPGRNPVPERIRFVTYTTKFSQCDWVEVLGLDQHYERSIVDARRTNTGITVTTHNVRVLRLHFPELKKGSGPIAVEIDGTKLSLPVDGRGSADFEKVNFQWTVLNNWAERTRQTLEKRPGLQGPIDDAFTHSFVVVGPSGPSWHPEPAAYTAAEQGRLAREWNKFFRGDLPVVPVEKLDTQQSKSRDLILFGDPQSNPLIAKVLPKLPITWTKDELVVNGVKYDPKVHVPVLIYPNPINPGGYVVINSGHTFKAADLNGTNALLYPRLGDWAVLKPTPTKSDPTAYEVVAAGLFDENWRFPKK